MTKVIKVKYERGVLKPLEPLDLEEGRELFVKIVDTEDKKRVLEKYKGALDHVDPDLVEEALEEAEHL